MSLHEFLAAGSVLTVLVTVAVVVLVVLYPWFLLFALRRMAKAHAAVASALANQPGRKDLSESMEFLQAHISRMADAQAESAIALGRLADAMAALNAPPSTPPPQHAS